MKNYIQPGETITVAAPYAVASGAGVKVGSLFGVAAFDAASGAELEIARTGVFDLAKKAATAVTAGAKVYWDDAAKEVNTTASGNTLIGAALSDAEAAAALVRVVLDGAAR